MTIRPYQTEITNRIYDAWSAGHKNVMPVLFTGGGKTHVCTGIMADEPGHTCAIAHRQELVGQWSLALNKRGVKHFVIAPPDTVKWLVGQHIREHGVSHYQTGARCAVAGVGTLTSKTRRPQMAEWGRRVSLWVIDEGHHCLRKNCWGRAAELFPNAYGLMPTATPERTDGQGLGRHADGIADVMVFGPSGRDLIEQGYLTDYRIFSASVGIDRSALPVSSTTGEFNQIRMIAAVHENKKIVGGIVENYLKYAGGKLGITFVTDVETAATVAQAYTAAGVPAEAVSANTPDRIRAEINRRLQRGDLKNVVNVDIYGEGYDCPAIEVVSMARPTESYGLHVQQFGRGLRPLAGKTHAVIIDHVGNVMRHGLPDAPREWSLDSREKRSNGRNHEAIPMRVCTGCSGIYEAFHPVCPYCGVERLIVNRSRAEFVDGDLFELDPSVLAEMRGEIARIDQDPDRVRQLMQRGGAPAIAAMGAAKQHRLRQEAQTTLREAIALWAGIQRHAGQADAESYKRFYWRFGVDVMSAQALGRPEAEKLTGEINKTIWG